MSKLSKFLKKNSWIAPVVAVAAPFILPGIGGALAAGALGAGSASAGLVGMLSSGVGIAEGASQISAIATVGSTIKNIVSPPKQPEIQYTENIYYIQQSPGYAVSAGQPSVNSQEGVSYTYSPTAGPQEGVQAYPGGYGGAAGASPGYGARSLFSPSVFNLM